ncbi:MAG: LysM peptidoglycan-binding domain-containing protein [Anaerolineae bacterium]
MNRRLWYFAILAALLFVLSAIPVLSAPPPTPMPLVTPVVPAAPPIPPVPPSYPIYHQVQWGENLTRIAMRYGTTVWAIAQANGIWNINYIRAGQVLLIPVPGPIPGPMPRTYIVQPGDTLSAIAWRFGTTVWALAQANGIWNPNLIYIGQRLYIP